MRIASLLSSATEMVCGLGLEDSLVAISHECDYPSAILDRPRVTHSLIDSDQDSLAIDADVKSRLRQGLPLYAIAEEKLASLRPDLILTQSQCDVCAIRLEDVHTFVQSQPILVQTKIIALSPQTLGDVLADIQTIAEAAGVSQRGQAYVESLRNRVAEIQRRTNAKLGQSRPRTLCIEWTDPLMAAGNWTPELVRLAGGEPGLAEAGKHSPYVTWEQVEAYDPDVLLFAPCGFGLERSWEETQQLRSKHPLDDLRAVKNGRAFVLDGNALFNRSGPRLVDTLEVIAHLLADIQPDDAANGADFSTWYRRLIG